MNASLETPAQRGHIRSGLASVTNATLQVTADGQEMVVGLDRERLELPLVQSARAGGAVLSLPTSRNDSRTRFLPPARTLLHCSRPKL